ncbi:unnamed protein product, partial [Hapterophycus canaliculatus]
MFHRFSRGGVVVAEGVIENLDHLRVVRSPVSGGGHTIACVTGSTPCVVWLPILQTGGFRLTEVGLLRTQSSNKSFLPCEQIDQCVGYSRTRLYIFLGWEEYPSNVS